MYIAEQNMVGTAVGLYTRGKLPFVSTFAAFFTRAFDQIRMSQYSEANIKFCGSHAGVSIGEDGPSQMGLEDIAMFRNIIGSVVLYPADAVSTEKLVEQAARLTGIVYLRTTRGATPVIYDPAEEFEIGGNKVLRKSDRRPHCSGGRGHHSFRGPRRIRGTRGKKTFPRESSIFIASSRSTLPFSKKRSARRRSFSRSRTITPKGGLGEAVRTCLAGRGISVHSLAITKLPKSGKPAELLDYEEISKKAVVDKVKELL